MLPMMLLSAAKGVGKAIGNMRVGDNSAPAQFSSNQSGGSNLLSQLLSQQPKTDGAAIDPMQAASSGNQLSGGAVDPMQMASSGNQIGKGLLGKLLSGIGA